MTKQTITKQERSQRYRNMRAAGASREHAQYARDCSEWWYERLLRRTIRRNLLEQSLGTEDDSKVSIKGGS